MPTFRYKALTINGNSVSGQVDAEKEEVVLEHIYRQNLLPIEIKNKTTDPWWSWNIEDLWGLSFNTRELSLFSSQLARLLRSGVELDQAVRFLIELATNKKSYSIILHLEESIRRGSSLSDAMERERGVFPSDYVSMVRAGESTGTLGQSLDRLAILLKRRGQITQRVVSALIYPSILLVMAVCSVAIMLTFVLPQFEPLFADANISMPFSTQIVVSFSKFIRGYWWVWCGILICLLVFWINIRRTPSMLIIRDRLILQTRLLGPLILRADIARLTRTLGVLIQNGVMLAPALAVAVEGVKNSYLRTSLDEAAVLLRQGEGLAACLAKSGCFPKLMQSMIAIGEESGRLDEMLLEVSDLYEDEMQLSIDRMLALLVPVLTIGMGLVVAFIVASMLQAMLSINSLPL